MLKSAGGWGDPRRYTTFIGNETESLFDPCRSEYPGFACRFTGKSGLSDLRWRDVVDWLERRALLCPRNYELQPVSSSNPPLGQPDRL
jgi:hypothetical protein